MLYEERQIEDGREFYDESQQTVRLLRDADKPRDVEVVSADDVSPAVWSIQILPQPGNSEDEMRLLGARIDPHGRFRELVFTHYADASALAHWLRTNPKPTLQQMMFNYVEGASLVAVRKTQNECKPLQPGAKRRIVYQQDGAGK